MYVSVVVCNGNYHDFHELVFSQRRLWPCVPMYSEHTKGCRFQLRFHHQHDQASDRPISFRATAPAQSELQC